MPTTNVNNFDTIEEWRLKTNEIGVKVADLDNNLFTINVIASGNITASGNINALGNVVVSKDVIVSGNVLTSGNLVVSKDAIVTGNIFGASNLNITGNVLAANVQANVHYGTWITSKPAINVLFNANITGSANLLLSNSGTNIVTISANVANDSVTLGTHTVGNYVKEITSADTGNIIVNNGTGEGTTPTVNLAMTAVTPGQYGNANNVSSFSVTRDGRLVAASNVAIDRAYILNTGKPSINVAFTGDVAGTANLNLSNENTNFLSVGLTIQPDSVALGTDTTGNYVASLVQGSGITITGAATENATPTIAANVRSVGSFVGDVSNSNLLASLLQVDGAGSGLDADVLDGQNGTYYLDWVNQTNKPALNLTFTGDVTGTGGINLTNSGTNSLSIGLTIGADSVALGTDTTGNYVQQISSADTANIIVNNGTGEGSSPTVNLGMTNVTPGTYGGANNSSAFTVTRDGRLVAASNVTPNFEALSNKPAVALTFTGDVTGAGAVTLNNAGNNSLSIGLTIGADSVALGTDTTGNYTNRVVGGTGISTTGTADEGNVITVGLTNTTVSSGSYGTANAVAQFNVDSTGRLTAASNVTIDRRYVTVTEKPSINLRFTGDATGAGNITISQSDKNELAINMTVISTANVTANALPTTTVSPGTYGGTDRVPHFTVDSTGRLTNAGNVQLVYSSVSNKPSVNLTFTGDVTGAGSINLANENTNNLSIGLTIAADSVALGTDTTGNYTTRVVGGTGISATGTADEGNVITVGLTNTGVAATTYGNARIIPSFTVDAQGRITSASNVTLLSDVANIVLTGDVTGSANVVLGPNSSIISITTTIAADSVALGTDTTGNYTARVEPGTMMTATGTANEGNVITINHADTSTLNGTQGGSGIASITVDDRGHVTAVTTATYCTSVPASSNVFSYFGAGANTISLTRTTHSTINSTGFNFFAGSCAGNAITTGNNNIFFGACAGCKNTSGNENTFAGLCAGFNNTTGSYNLFWGRSAGVCNTSACRNIYLGNNSGGNVTTGNDNIMFGCLTSFAGLCQQTSNVIIMATGGVRKLTIFGHVDPTTGETQNGIFIGQCAGACVGAAGSNLNNIAIGSCAAFCSLNTGGSIYIGTCAGYCDCSGSDNIGIGSSAGISLRFGRNNIFLGHSTGANITSGCDNIIFGRVGSNNGFTDTTSNVIIFATAGRIRSRFDFNTCNLLVGNDCQPATTTHPTGVNNVAFGVHSGRNLSSGGSNSLFGTSAGPSISTGYFNTSIGGGSALTLTTGGYNIFLGSYAGSGVTSGCRNIILGSNNSCVSTGNNNFIVGDLSAATYTSQDTSNSIILATGGTPKIRYLGNALILGICNNFFAGSCAGNSLSSGTDNIAIGACSACKLSSGRYNVLLGQQTGCNLTTACLNTIIGYRAGLSTSTGGSNSFFGIRAGEFNTVGCRNVFLGNGAGRQVTTGCQNTIVGSYAGRYLNCGAINNTFLGNDSGYYMSGSCNIALGHQVGYYATDNFNSTCNNIAIGTQSLYGKAIYDVNGSYVGCSVPRGLGGNFNIAMGYRSGAFLTTGNNNIYIGCCAGSSVSGLGCCTTESNRIIMGNTSHACACIQIAWTTPSDIRDKCIFGCVPHGKTFLQKINPITFSFKNRETNELKETKKRYGFSAQEVLEAEGDDPVIVGAENPEKLGFTTDFIIPILVNAIKELTKDVEELRAEIVELKKSR